MTPWLVESKLFVPEIRTDPVSGRQVIIAPQRIERPNAIQLTPWCQDDQDRCPFCSGREDQTPTELASYRLPGDEQPWHVRVVPNRYPAMFMETVEVANDESELLPAAAVRGQHEVIIESPRHVTSFSELTDSEAALVVQAYRDRQAVAAHSSVAAGMIFKNFGPRAGASLGHIHSQFVGFGSVPPELKQEYAAADIYAQQHGSCLFCAIVTTETRLAKRLVLIDDLFIAFCPFASRLPFEMCIMPRQHRSHFERQNDEECAILAKLLLRLLRRLETTIPHVAYNFWVHSAAFDSSSSDHYHWHIELLPRLVTTAGFEWGSGQLINPVPPEKAAEQLRLC